MRVIENIETGETASEAASRRKRDRLSKVEKPKRKAIKKVSDKRKKENDEYKPLREKYLLDHPECELKMLNCTIVATQIHHCSMSHLDFLNIHTWKGGCDSCHKIVERVLSAKERRDKGLLI